MQRVKGKCINSRHEPAAPFPSALHLHKLDTEMIILFWQFEDLILLVILRKQTHPLALMYNRTLFHLTKNLPEKFQQSYLNIWESNIKI